MRDEERDARWQSLLALQEQLEEGLPSPAPRPAADGRPRARSPKAARFAAALDVSTAWSGIDAARDRRPAA
jgi:hypothetical protein